MRKTHNYTIKIYILIAFLLIPILVYSQELTLSLTDNHSANTQAVQFHIIGGIAASYCIPIMDQSQIRFTIDLGLNSNTQDGDSKQTSSSGASSSYQNANTSRTDKRYSIDFIASYIYLLNAKKDIRPFLGFGIVGNYGKSWYHNTENRSEPMSSFVTLYEFEDNSTTRGFGLRGTLGCEAFVTSHVSMLAEYQLSVLRTWTESDYSNNLTSLNSINQSESKSDFNGWQITLHSIRIGFAVHF